jgi:hypothetical protein
MGRAHPELLLLLLCVLRVWSRVVLVLMLMLGRRLVRMEWRHWSAEGRQRWRS